MVKSDGTAMPNPPFDFVPSTRLFTIVSLTDSSITGSYNLKYVATNSHSAGTIFLEDTFNVVVNCDIVSSYVGTTAFSY